MELSLSLQWFVRRRGATWPGILFGTRSKIFCSHLLLLWTTTEVNYRIQSNHNLSVEELCSYVLNKWESRHWLRQATRLRRILFDSSRLYINRVWTRWNIRSLPWYGYFKSRSSPTFINIFEVKKSLFLVTCWHEIIDFLLPNTNHLIDFPGQL